MTHNPIQMVDLQLQYVRLKTEIDQAVLDVMGDGRYINGPDVKLFGEELSVYLGVQHVITCANGTDALQLALMALNLKPGDEVITTSFSFFATAEVIALLGLVPVFADIDPLTYNIDCSLIESLITPKTKCIMPVHLFGQGADMAEILQIAETYKLAVIEDAAQALGGSFNLSGKQRKYGTLGHIGCTSFFPTKNLGCFGDGGAVLTNDSKLAEQIKLLASHGSTKQYIHKRVGINSRLDTLQAAILKVKLPYMDELIEMRQKIASKYLDELNGIRAIILPGLQKNAEHTFNQFAIRVLNGKRDKLQSYLKDYGIATRIYYPLALHHQEALKNHLKYKPTCSEAERLCDEVLSLPIYPFMKADETVSIIDAIKSFFNPL